MKHTILCVDDEIDNLDALERVFRTNFHVLKASSGRQALDFLDQHREPIAVLLTDQRMPQMTGVEFLTESMQTHPDSLRILLTGYTDMESIIAAVNRGQIYRYLNKPWDPVDLLKTVETAAETFQLQRDLKQKNIELATALDELKTLDQAKNQFMMLINHELKTPLTSIVSFADLLRESGLNREQMHFLGRIQRSTQRLQDLVADVLLIVGAEAKVLKTKIQPIPMAPLFDSIKMLLAESLAQKSQQLHIDSDNGKKLIADEGMIRQVLQRIVHNASKFGSESSLIKLVAQEKLPHRMSISIYNEGSRISPEVIHKILQPFYLDEEVMNHSVGLGLGLTICQSLLKLHNSHLQIIGHANGVEVSFDLACL